MKTVIVGIVASFVLAIAFGLVLVCLPYSALVLVPVIAYAIIITARTSGEIAESEEELKRKGGNDD
jgi:hypothetical protein